MKNKLQTLLVATCGLFITSLSSADSSVTQDVTFGSDYVFRGIKLGEDTLHPSIEFAIDDFYAGVWAALPQAGKGWNTFYDEEYDLYAGKSFALDNGLVLDVGATYYMYDESDETFEFYVGSSVELEAITVSGYVYRDIDLKTTTLEFSGAYTLPISDEFGLDLGLYAGLVNAEGDGDYSYYGFDAVAPFQLTENVTVSLGLHFADHNLDDLRTVMDSAMNSFQFPFEDSHTYFSVSGTYGF